MKILYVILEQSWLEYSSTQVLKYIIRWLYFIYFSILILLKRAQIRHSCLKCCLRSISNAVCPDKYAQFTVNLYNVASIGYICILVLRPAVYQTLELEQKFWQNFCTRCRKKGIYGIVIYAIDGIYWYAIYTRYIV